MNNVNGVHIEKLKKNMYKIKFLIVAYFIYEKGSLDYKLVNLIIYIFFDKKHIIHSGDYKNFFINSDNFDLIIVGNKYKVNSFNNNTIDINNYKYEFNILSDLYDKLIIKSDKQLSSIYYKIF